MIEKLKRRIQPLINVYHLIKAVIANIIYGFPSKKIKIIGVTGTDGKTTTTHLIYHILKSAGKKVSMLSSIYAKIGDLEYDTGLHMTTPDVLLVQKLINYAAKNKDEYLVLETTSHALDQNRIYGISYEISVITNITPEHLDYHKTYDNYLRTKAKLLLRAKKSLINLDDHSSDRLIKILSAKNKKFYTYGFSKGTNYSKDFSKIISRITDFNNYNYLAAFSVAKLLDIDERTIIDALRRFRLPTGRFELVYNKEFYVIVDFAHTPNAIDQVLEAVRKHYVIGEKQRLIHVFGSAGLRDNKKRPMMGDASGRHADVVILTEEDYRTEDPLKICEEVAMGLIKNDFKKVEAERLDGRSKKAFSIIIERNLAIKKAVGIAQKGDVIVATGKSHEKSLCRGKIEYPWNETEAILKALKLPN